MMTTLVFVSRTNPEDSFKFEWDENGGVSNMTGFSRLPKGYKLTEVYGSGPVAKFFKEEINRRADLGPRYEFDKGKLARILLRKSLPKWRKTKT